MWYSLKQDVRGKDFLFCYANQCKKKKKVGVKPEKKMPKELKEWEKNRGSKDQTQQIFLLLSKIFKQISFIHICSHIYYCFLNTFHKFGLGKVQKVPHGLKCGTLQESWRKKPFLSQVQSEVFKEKLGSCIIKHLGVKA